MQTIQPSALKYVSGGNNESDCQSQSSGDRSGPGGYPASVGQQESQRPSQSRR